MFKSKLRYAFALAISCIAYNAHAATGQSASKVAPQTHSNIDKLHTNNKSSPRSMVIDTAGVGISMGVLGGTFGALFDADPKTWAISAATSAVILKITDLLEHRAAKPKIKTGIHVMGWAAGGATCGALASHLKNLKQSGIYPDVFPLAGMCAAVGATLAAEERYFKKREKLKPKSLKTRLIRELRGPTLACGSMILFSYCCPKKLAPASYLIKPLGKALALYAGVEIIQHALESRVSGK